MKIAPLLQNYQLLVDKADRAFKEMKEAYAPNIMCKRHCSDCCHAVFGLFLIEAAFVKQQFDELHKEKRKAALLRCSETEKGLRRLEKMLKQFENDPNMQAYTMARERIRCPLLNENNDCMLYDHRPITCRVYGIPTRIQGKARVCGKAGFEKGKSYPAFDLDGMYRDLFILSRELLNSAERGEPEKASLMISVSKVLSVPLHELIHETFE